jgi:hypothetical protein
MAARQSRVLAYFQAIKLPKNLSQRILRVHESTLNPPPCSGKSKFSTQPANATSSSRLQNVVATFRLLAGTDTEKSMAGKGEQSMG